MTSKNKVYVIVKGKDNSTVAIGGVIGHPSPGNSENEVRVNINGQNLTTIVAGADIVESDLQGIRELLAPSLRMKGEKEGLEEVIKQLTKQANKTKKEQNESKIKKLMDELSAYIGITALALGNAEKVKTLYENIAHFFGF